MKPSLLERAYLSLHHCRYRRRQRRQVGFDRKYIISVGNLSAGGTGKTPTTALLARALGAASMRTLLLLRGYGGSLSKKGALVSEGGRIFCNARQAGDEALELALELSEEAGIKVAIGRNRADMIRREGGNLPVVLLDDAFQNPSVRCDHHLALMDATVSPANMRLYPLGPFREPLTALSRADTALLTRCDQATPSHLEYLRRQAGEMLGPAALFESRHSPVGIFPAFPADLSNLSKPAPSAEASPQQPQAIGSAGAFCGIGQPEAFFNSLEQLGVRIAERLAFRDHHPYRRRDIERIFSSSPLPWITTSKDLARLRGQDLLTPKEKGALYILKVRIDILAGREEQFLDRIIGPSLPPPG